MINWYNIADSKDKHMPFTFVIGARGIGKIYSVIDYDANYINKGRKEEERRPASD